MPRTDNHLRKMYAESGISLSDLICPVFVSEKQQNPSSMMGSFVSCTDSIVSKVESIEKSGLSNIILFGIPERRDRTGQQAAHRDGPVQKAIRSIKSAFGEKVNLIADVCVCQYNESGHCGIITGGSIDNDRTLALLCRIASSLAAAGADIVAPSAMMDGQVLAIRNTLRGNGSNAKILAYSAKHSSSLYVPFRSTAFASSGAIDKSSYQVSPCNPMEAMREIKVDIAEGADMVMIKPSFAYLDLVTMASERFDVPLVVQNVSGEYAMVKAAADYGWINLREWLAGMMFSFKRSGADKIITYFAPEVALELILGDDEDA